MNQEKTKLHELLAVEQDRKATAERTRNQTVESFRANQAHFNGMRRTFRPFMVDEDKGEVGGERLEGETRLVKTVHEELELAFRSVGKAMDIGLQIDEANTRARGDIEVDGNLLAKDVPVTFLLQLEKRIGEIRALVKEAPTFDPVRTWSVDPGADKKNVLRADPVLTVRKQRARKYKVMYEATKEHPAQIDVVEVDEPVGEIRTYDWTGMISPGRKATMLDHIDKLAAAVKAARSRANNIDADGNQSIADKLLAYVLSA